VFITRFIITTLTITLHFILNFNKFNPKWIM
jgi:hypothetical protein